MVATDAFSQFARRMVATQNCPYAVIVETPNPVRGLDPTALRARAEAMLPAVIEGFTLQTAEIERRTRAALQKHARPVRASQPV